MADQTALPYRPCVGVMVLNSERLVWVGHRKFSENHELTGASRLWQMPQGGIDPGEEPLAAAKRELYEETGIRSVELAAESSGWINYDLPPELLGVALKGRYRGQTQKWFAFHFTGDASEVAIDPPPDGHPAEFDEWAWKPMDEVLDLIVPFKRSVYQVVIREFRHLETA
ncbi:RNA pyrophosphohydrolase [Consotaella aegiceratis]|uniref:RNA pyrophosphohydrolase n=1 Tax=Consotaella aegiceratis TaxID=3097961 RepID=UPI002F42CC24